ncbi:MAG: hypothetical protein RR949_06395 [Oscillospiraceae bacterium]
MKTAKFVMKLVAVFLAVAAAVCCVVAYWEKIQAFFVGIKGRCEEGGCCCHHESDDYADWDE